MNKQLRIQGDVESQVIHLARIVYAADLDGVIVSTNEIEAILKKVSRNLLIVTAGVRQKWATVNDQKRIMTPGEAILKGASYRVIGRPITRPPTKIGTPVDAAKRMIEEINQVLERVGFKYDG